MDKTAGKSSPSSLRAIVPSIPVLNPPIQNHYEYRAATNCRVLNIPRRRFFEIGLGINLPNNGLFDSVLDSLSSDLGNLLVRYGYFLALDLVGRVAFTLLELAEKFGIRDTRRVILPHFFSHDDLADLVGASRSRVTSAVSILERQHIIGREGRQIVVDIVALKAFIASRTSKRPDPLLLEAAVPK